MINPHGGKLLSNKDSDITGGFTIVATILLAILAWICAAQTLHLAWWWEFIVGLVTAVVFAAIVVMSCAGPDQNGKSLGDVYMERWPVCNLVPNPTISCLVTSTTVLAMGFVVYSTQNFLIRIVALLIAALILIPIGDAIGGVHEG